MLDLSNTASPVKFTTMYSAMSSKLFQSSIKVSMRFRGREMEHKNLGFDLLKRLTEQVVEHAKVEVHPKSEGRQIMMILVPQVAK